MEILVNLFEATINGFRVLLFGYNETTTIIYGQGLLTVVFSSYIVKSIIKNISFNTNDIIGSILSNIITQPINKLLDYCSNKYLKI